MPDMRGKDAKINGVSGAHVWRLLINKMFFFNQLFLFSFLMTPVAHSMHTHSHTHDCRNMVSSVF